jgi:hypothetical protein
MKTLCLAAALVAAAGLCACGQKSETRPAGSVDSAGAPAGAAGGCAGYRAGENGVIRTFCDGTAKVTVTVDGKSYSLSGGECSLQMGMAALNVGVVTGSPAPTPLPDYVGLTAASGYGAFKDAALPLHLGGQDIVVRPNSGTFTDKGGTFEGTVMGSGHKVTGSFTC